MESWIEYKDKLYPIKDGMCKIKFTLTGYEDLDAEVAVSKEGLLSCDNPDIAIEGNKITGNLKPIQ